MDKSRVPNHYTTLVFSNKIKFKCSFSIVSNSMEMDLLVLFFFFAGVVSLVMNSIPTYT